MSAEAWGIVAQLGARRNRRHRRHGRVGTDALTTEYGSPHHRVWALAIRVRARACKRRVRGDGTAHHGRHERGTRGLRVRNTEVHGPTVHTSHRAGTRREVLDAGRDFVALYPQVPAWRAGLSVILSETGLYEEAREQLAALTVNGLGTLRRDQEWLFLMGAVAETCSSIGAADVATRSVASCSLPSPTAALFSVTDTCCGARPRSHSAFSPVQPVARTMPVGTWGALRGPSISRSASPRWSHHVRVRTPRFMRQAAAPPWSRIGSPHTRLQATSLGQCGLIRSMRKFADDISRADH